MNNLNNSSLSSINTIQLNNQINITAPKSDNKNNIINYTIHKSEPIKA
jgi:hypothetical protein